MNTSASDPAPALSSSERPGGALKSLYGEVRIVDDVPGAYANLVAREIKSRDVGKTFRLACSGGSSGSACLEALLAADPLECDLEQVEWFLADERCVPVDDERSNYGALMKALATRGRSHAIVHRLTCEDPGAYGAILRSESALDLLQLGFGPDGHTASLFADSPALQSDAGTMVRLNTDPSGRNPLPRVTLTLAGIARAKCVVIAVIGEEKAEALARIGRGEDLPASRVRAERLVWLIDQRATADLT